MRCWSGVLLVPVLIACGCSKALGYDDIAFTPGPGSTDAALSDVSESDVTLDSAGQDAGAEASPNDAGSEAADSPSSACDGVTCSGQGDCVLDDGGMPSCSCHAGYHAEGQTCVVDESCSGVDCGRCGQCEVSGGKAICTCPQGFTHNGTSCVVDPDPCSPNPCDSEHVCVPEAHCQPLGACVPTCDCSNCGNCGSDNSDGRWNDWQEYCGNLNASPATMACTKPCAPGDGCIPYNPPMCWPMEGCFSM